MPTDPTPTPPPQPVDDHKMSPRSYAILATTGLCLVCETALVIAERGESLQMSLGGALVVLVPAAMHSLGVDFGKWRR
jgi:hypothetical protein